jgi:hypothetical protein
MNRCRLKDINVKRGRIKSLKPNESQNNIGSWVCGLRAFFAVSAVKN